MANDVANHTLKLLKEMRTEMRVRFDEVNGKFDEVNTKIAGLTHMTMLLASNMGGHDERLDDLEAAVKALQKS